MSNSILSEKEQKIIEALRASPQLEGCFLEMIDIAGSPLGTLDCGDEAEEAVVSVIQKTGKLLLEEWAQKKSDEAAEEMQAQSKTHLHGKKTLLANFFRSCHKFPAMLSKEEGSFVRWKTN
jgi:hypothetical protein